jgi:organic hydroperoxide reductase OsmC/OhrA
MLSYLHVCADAGISVLEYSDDADGEMVLNADGSGRFTAVTLRPRVVIAEGGDADNAQVLHHLAHEKCFIANSVNFPVSFEATIEIRAAQGISAPRADLQQAV